MAEQVELAEASEVAALRAVSAAWARAAELVQGWAQEARRGPDRREAAQLAVLRA